MSTSSTSSLTECSPVRSASTRRRRVGSARIWKASGIAKYYLSDICRVNNTLQGGQPGRLANSRRFARLVGRDHHPGRRRLGVEEPESGQRPAVAEETASSPTAEDHQILSRLLLEPGHGVAGVAFEECGVAPRKRLLQRSRRDVLLGVVEDVDEGIVPPFGPETGEVLVGPPPQQKRPTSGYALRRRGADDGIHP